MVDLNKLIERVDKEIRVSKRADSSMTLIPVQYAEEILDILKKQEPVRVGKKIKAGDVVLDFYSCGHCKNAIRKPWRYCPFCGKAVKWDV